jgi:hypothetical protein
VFRLFEDPTRDDMGCYYYFIIIIIIIIIIISTTINCPIILWVDPKKFYVNIQFSPVHQRVGMRCSLPQRALCCTTIYLHICTCVARLVHLIRLDLMRIIYNFAPGIGDDDDDDDFSKMSNSI